MNNIFSKFTFKNTLILACFILCLFSFSSKASASAGNNVFGYAWSENIGWISFNNCVSPDPSTCSGSDYGVSVQNDVWSGYAWSENIGWISFNPADWDIGNPSYDNSTSQAYGRAISAINNDNAGGWDGWISISGSASSISWAPTIGTASTYNGGGSSTLRTGPMAGYKVKEVSGYIWGSDVVGWVDMAPFYGGSGYPSYGGVYIYEGSLLLTATPSTVKSSSAVTKLSWSSPDGTAFSSCTSTGGGTDWNNLSEATPSASKSNIKVPSNPTTFKIKCTKTSGGDLYAETTVNIDIIKTNALIISASPTVVDAGDPTDLSWYSPNGTVFTGQCTASGGGSSWNGTVNQPTKTTKVQKKTGVSVVSPKTTFVITCPTSGGNVSASVDVFVNSSSSNLSLKASPGIVTANNTTNLTWNSASGTTYTSCSALGGGTDWNMTSQNGLSASTTPPFTEIKNVNVGGTAGAIVYSITCTKANGTTDTASTLVAINSNPADLKIISDPTTVASGGTTDLYWYSPNGKIYSTCYPSNGGSDWNTATGIMVPSTFSSWAYFLGASVPSNPTIFSVTCEDASGNLKYASTIVDQGTTSLILSADKSTVNSGDTVNLTYSSPTGAVYSICVGTGGDSNWNGNPSVPNGTASTTISGVGVPTYPTTVYVLECTTSAGVTDTATAQVDIDATITAHLTASPAVVASGGSSDLSWTTDNATATTTCSASWTSQTDPNSATPETISSITVPSTYTIDCSDSFTGATSSDSVNIDIVSADSLSQYNGSCINSGASARFGWTSSNATSCTINYYNKTNSGSTPDQSFSSLSASGSNYALGITAGGSNNDGTGTYKIFCSNGSENSTEGHAVSVSACSPSFTVSGKTTCDTATGGNTFFQVPGTALNDPYKATVTFVANALNGFNSSLSLTVDKNNYNNSDVGFQWTSASVNSPYSKTLTMTIAKNKYVNFMKTLTNNYGTIKITASGGGVTKTVNFGVCGSGGSLPVPIYREI